MRIVRGTFGRWSRRPRVAFEHRRCSMCSFPDARGRKRGSVGMCRSARYAHECYCDIACHQRRRKRDSGRPADSNRRYQHRHDSKEAGGRGSGKRGSGSSIVRQSKPVRLWRRRCSTDNDLESPRVDGHAGVQTQTNGRPYDPTGGFVIDNIGDVQAPYVGGAHSRGTAHRSGTTGGIWLGGQRVHQNLRCGSGRVVPCQAGRHRR